VNISEAVDFGFKIGLRCSDTDRWAESFTPRLCGRLPAEWFSGCPGHRPDWHPRHDSVFGGLRKRFPFLLIAGFPLKTRNLKWRSRAMVP